LGIAGRVGSNLSPWRGRLKRRAWQANIGERIVQLYEKWGKLDRAEEWRELLDKDREALAGLSAASGG